MKPPSPDMPAPGDGFGLQPPARPLVPDPKFPHAPAWFRHSATEARKLLNRRLAGAQCQAKVRNGINAYGKNMKFLPLFPPLSDRPNQDWYAILFAAHDLCFPLTPVGSKNSLGLIW